MGKHQEIVQESRNHEDEALFCFVVTAGVSVLLFRTSNSGLLLCKQSCQRTTRSLPSIDLASQVNGQQTGIALLLSHRGALWFGEATISNQGSKAVMEMKAEQAPLVCLTQGHYSHPAATKPL